MDDDYGTLVFDVGEPTDAAAIARAPYWSRAAGDEWIAFSISLLADPSASAVVGFSRGRWRAAPADDRAGGSRLLAAIARALDVDAPTPASTLRTPLEVRMTLLSRDGERFAMKLFCDGGGELFFTVDLGTLLGSFGMKEADATMNAKVLRAFSTVW